MNIASTNTTLPTISGVSSNVEAIYGANIGAFAEIKVTDKFGVQPELLFSMQGLKQTLSGGGLSYEDEISLSYINIPIMAKIYVSEKFSLQAGPQVGFLIAATDKITTNITGLVSESKDSKDEYTSTDFGFNFGVGFQINKNISIDARYNLGLSELDKNLDPGQSENKNRVFSLNFGYSF